jgi:hypothetical protein
MRRGLGWEQRGYVSVKSALVGLLPAAVDCRVAPARLLSARPIARVVNARSETDGLIDGWLLMLRRS